MKPQSTEAEVQAAIRLEASRRGMRLWRNNCGAFYDDKRLVRYGLANESSAVTKELKSSDLIGITPIRITPDMVGHVVGVFTSIECKRPGWSPDKPQDKRTQAQMNWLKLILSMGGIAQFATSPADIWRDAGRGNPGDNGG